ncbi:MAG: acetoacetate--CoA ligase [Microthrixaceae bacterium]
MASDVDSASPLGTPTPRVLWQPLTDAASSTQMGRFAARCSEHTGQDLSQYQDLWRWSVTDLEEFWTQILVFFDLITEGDIQPVLTGENMFGAKWFPHLQLNYAENALRGPSAHRSGFADDEIAVQAESQLWGKRVLTRGELRSQVAACQQGLIELGVGVGDVVAAYLPNLAETIIGFLACAGLGATWASCAPEFGVKAVIDRLSQLNPKLLLAVEGYGYGEKMIDRRADLEEIRCALSSLEHTVVLPSPNGVIAAQSIGAQGVSTWQQLLSTPGELVTHRVAFDHPLYVLFSSGTTGLPKPIVHGHGGMLIEHVKALGLHSDLGPTDAFFWFSTTGWMMWNLLVSGLLIGCKVICFDGDPVRPDPSTLWKLAAQTEATYFGCSASYLMAERARGARPAVEHDLSKLRAVGSTGSPLPLAGFEWVHEQFGPLVQLSSKSGGTDVCTAVVGSAPSVEVWGGEISCRYLGAAVQAFDERALPVIGVQGELVISAPMPSMPVAFAGDPDRSRLKAAYYEQYPGVWAHGDWITITDRGSCVISGRSDATLNRGGVRLGTSEFYAVVEALAEIVDSLVVHLEDSAGGSGQLMLFVVLAPGVSLDEELRQKLVSQVRNSLSPRHVPDQILQIWGVPRTLSGKKVEVPVKRVLRGATPSEVVSLDSLTDRTSLDQFVGLLSN